MSTQTIPAPQGTIQPPGVVRGAWIILLVEAAIGGLWLAGCVHYLLHGGPYATAVLAASLFLFASRLPFWIAFTLKPATECSPALWLYLLGIFLPGHLGGAGRIAGPHLVPLVLAIVCLAVQASSGYLSQRYRTSLQCFHATRWLGLFTVAYMVAGAGLAIGKLHAFGYVGQDIGYFMQCLYTGLHGKLFASNQYHDLLYTQTVSSDFAGHNQPVLFVLLPLYWIFPHAETLFLVRNIFLALSAYPVYQLSRIYLRAVPSSLLTVAFLTAPAVLFQNFYDYAPLSLVGLPLLFSLLFYHRGLFAPYIAALALCLFVREDLVFVLFGMGAVALISRRKAAWSLVPITIAMLWTVLTWGIILPHFQHGAVSAVEGCFAYLGATRGEMLHTLLSQPSLVVSHKSLVYMMQMFTPFGLVLPLWSPVSLVSAPYLLINILGDPGCNAAIVFRHYSLIPSVLLLPGTILAVRWLSLRSSLRMPAQSILALTVALASLGATILSVGQAELNWWHRADWQDEAKRVAAIAPDSAALAVPRYMLPLTANRAEVYQTLRLLDYHHPLAEYIVVDKDPVRMGVTEEWQPHFVLLLRALSDSENFRKVYESNNYQVYRSNGAPLRSTRTGSER